MELLKDLFDRKTFVSIFGTISIFILILIIIYQLLFTNLGGGASLGVAIEFVGIIILFFLILFDRILLNFLLNKKWLSIIETILIIGFLIYYFISHNNSFSVG